MACSETRVFVGHLVHNVGKKKTKKKQKNKKTKKQKKATTIIIYSVADCDGDSMDVYKV